jgi:hypothetical protein
VFVSDEDAVEVIKIQADSGQACQSFPFAKPGVHKDAGAFGFEQRQIARTAGRQYGNAQADDVAPWKKAKTFKIMAERNGSVNDFNGLLEEKVEERE